MHFIQSFLHIKELDKLVFIVSSSAMNQVVSLCVLGCAVIFVVGGSNIGISKQHKHANSSDIVSKCNETYHIKMGKLKL